MKRIVWPLLSLLLAFSPIGCKGCQPKVLNDVTPDGASQEASPDLGEMQEGWEFTTEIRTKELMPDGQLLGTREVKHTIGIPGKSFVETLEVSLSHPIPELNFELQRRASLSGLFWEKEGVMLTLDHIRGVYTRTTGEFPSSPSQPLSAIGYTPMGEVRELAGLSCEMWKKNLFVEGGSLVMEECWTKSKETPFYEWRPDLLPEDGYTMPLYLKQTRFDLEFKIVFLREEITTTLQRKDIPLVYLQPPAEYREISPEEFDEGYYPPPPDAPNEGGDEDLESTP